MRLTNHPTIMNQQDWTLLLFLLSLCLFPVVSLYHHDASMFLYGSVCLLLIVYYQRDLVVRREGYNKMDFFPWNEVNLVKKRHRDSTVIDCGWNLDQNKTNNIFTMNDPVLAPYSNS